MPPVSEELLDSAELERKHKKKKKKKQLAEVEISAAVAEPVEEVAEEAVALAIVEFDDQEKKKKKKKKKEKREEEEVVMEEDMGGKRRREEDEDVGGKRRRDDGEDGEKPKKKKKKPKDGVVLAGAGAGDDLTPEAFREINSIALEGADCDFAPVTSFAASGFSDELLQMCTKFERPTPIQAQCWPIMNAKRDLVGIAETGSGKTLAFALPALTHILAAPAAGKPQPRVLVLAPTRELACQTAEAFAAAGAFCGLKTVCAYGGAPKGPQEAALREGVHVVVATPGRLLDFLEGPYCKLGGVSFLVLDEADQMLDLGFEEQIRNIVSSLGPKRQTALFSATWPTSIRKIAADFLENPVRVTVGSPDLSACGSVQQIVEVLEPELRDNRLIDLLKKYHASRKNRVIVFCLYKKETARVEQLIQRRGFSVVAIHGDLDQARRTAAIDKFKDGSEPLLVATDVAARGLDVKGVTHVINYTFPLTIENYVHRIGRTGRAGEKGVSHTLFTRNDKLLAGPLHQVLVEANEPVPEDLLKFGIHVKKKKEPKLGKIQMPTAGAAVVGRVVFADDDE